MNFVISRQRFSIPSNQLEGVTLGSGYITAMEASGLLNGAVFHHEQVPRRAALRKHWMASLVDSVSEADLIFFDPDNGIQGSPADPQARRPSRDCRAEATRPGACYRSAPIGTKLEVRSIAERLRSIGCERLEIVRFRLVSSQFYVIVDYDSALDARISSFAKKWGNWVKIYYL